MDGIVTDKLRDEDSAAAVEGAFELLDVRTFCVSSVVVLWKAEDVEGICEEEVFCAFPRTGASEGVSTRELDDGEGINIGVDV